MNTPTPRTDAATALTSQHRHDDSFGDPEFGWVTAGFARTLERELVAETTERDQLRAVFPRICAALGNGAFCTPTVSVGCIESIPNEVELVIAELRARAERAEAEAERYRLVTLRQDAELTTERARLDYLLQWDVTFHDRADIDAELSYGQRKKSTPTLP